MTMQPAKGKAQGTSATQRLRLALMAAEHVERIGARIRARREEMRLSRRALVQRMEGVVTENDLYRWERGQHRPQDSTLEALAKALEVDVAYFLIEEPAAPAPDLMRELGAQDRLGRVEALLEAIAIKLDLDPEAIAPRGRPDLAALDAEAERLRRERQAEPDHRAA
jgi:transcriptional regulator with XRE-family HTH domain